jgi:predicted S18 family serine protease
MYFSTSAQVSTIDQKLYFLNRKLSTSTMQEYDEREVDQVKQLYNRLLNLKTRRRYSAEMSLALSRTIQNRCA